MTGLNTESGGEMDAIARRFIRREAQKSDNGYRCVYSVRPDGKCAQCARHQRREGSTLCWLCQVVNHALADADLDGPRKSRVACLIVLKEYTTIAGALGISSSIEHPNGMSGGGGGPLAGKDRIQAMADHVQGRANQIRDGYLEYLERKLARIIAEFRESIGDEE